MTFDKWMNEVDAKVAATVGLSIHDLSDQPFMDWFEDEVTPTDAAMMALEDNGWEGV